jgi:general secretion pathway protein G
MMRNRRNCEAGFTLLEILVVVVIIGILAAFVAPSVFTRVGQAETVAAKAQLQIFVTALNMYRADNGDYPTTEQGLAALRQSPTVPPTANNWSGPYLEGEVPKDPWGRDYAYKSPGEHNPTKFDLVSYGKDGQPGGEGDNRDVANW